MFLLKISLLCSLAASSHAQTAASQGQFRFAVENKFDDTGPGAKQKEFAYKTYSNYEDALIAYASDKDTKLPESDKARAYRKLVREEEYLAPPRYVHQSHTVLRNYPRLSTIPHSYLQPVRYRANRPDEFKNYHQSVMRYQPKPASEYTNSFLNNLRVDTPKIQIPPKVELPQQLRQSPQLHAGPQLPQSPQIHQTPDISQLQQRPEQIFSKLRYPELPQIVKQDLPLLLELSGSEGKRLQIAKGKGYKLKMVKPIKESPLRLSHYTKGSGYNEPLFHDEIEQNPEYTYSYGVHDRLTGDSKSAHETREGGTVRGFYTVLDADGKQRTVHYTADDKEGFRATVQRTDTNSHSGV